MGEWSQQIMAGIRERIVDEADATGADMVADIREKISTPVEYIETGDGVIVIRSDPFDYPRKDIGHLWGSEEHEVINGGAVIELHVRNTAAYARRLHDGHDNVAPRPFHDLAMLEWPAEIRRRIANAITRKE